MLLQVSIGATITAAMTSDYTVFLLKNSNGTEERTVSSGENYPNRVKLIPFIKQGCDCKIGTPISKIMPYH